MAFESIKKRSLYEEICDQIINYIHKENIQPGEKLPSENDLISIFQVSKTAVREALSVLAARGIIEKKPGVGSIVKELTGASYVDKLATKLIVGKQSLREILEFRRGMEVEAAALAAERATEKQLKEIERAHLELIRVNLNDGIGIEEDFLFHSLIIQASNNSMYQKIFEYIAPYYLEAMMITKNQSKIVSDSILKESHEEHENILKAISSRNQELARLYTLEHLQKNEHKIWSNHLDL